MPPFELTPEQTALVFNSPPGHTFLEGPAGTGKTTAAAQRLAWLLAHAHPGRTILVLVPQRTLAGPYLQVLEQAPAAQGVGVDVLTVGGLAQRMLDLFWPLVSGPAGFGQPDNLPTFLTLETAQYYMAHLVRPLLGQGFFDGVTIERNRLYSQILDNLNKAALVGFPHTEIGARLKAAWSGDLQQLRVYEDVQTCASQFRTFCLQNNLLDFSLQVEVFWNHLWPLEPLRAYLRKRYHRLIFDNLEEDTPLAHDLLAAWLPDFESALLLYDHQAGYRSFLGADPRSALRLRDACEHHLRFDRPLVSGENIQGLATTLQITLAPPTQFDAGFEPTPARRLDLLPAELEPPAWVRQALSFERHRYYPAMLDWVAAQISQLVHQEEVSPGEIVVLSPFLSDSLRFSLSQRLEQAGIPARSHRPSRSLRDEPITNCLLTLACLAFPSWSMAPSPFDVTYALVQSIAGMDLVRAQLLVERLYRRSDDQPALQSFDTLPSAMQQRLTYVLGEHFERLRLWLEVNRESPGEFDHFLSRLFGELLSQPGFGFHASFSAGEITANLIESIQKFRWVAGPLLLRAGQPLGKEYLHMVQDGVIAAQYVRSWQVVADDAVLLAPAYTFLLANRPASYQFWLDIGSRGWFERLEQPLTHPYVLSRGWQTGRTWGDADEEDANQRTLLHMALGLLRRCRTGVFLGLSDFSETGYEERGPLLHALQRVLQHAAMEAAGK